MNPGARISEAESRPDRQAAGPEPAGVLVLPELDRLRDKDPGRLEASDQALSGLGLELPDQMDQKVFADRRASTTCTGEYRPSAGRIVALITNLISYRF